MPETAFKAIMAHFKSSDVVEQNGWGFTTKTGLYGTNYLQLTCSAR